MRLIALRNVKNHMNVDSLGPVMMDLIGKMVAGSSSVLCTARDCWATNGKAECNIKPILSYAEIMMCVSHTISHCAGHVDLHTIKDFMTPRLKNVQDHPTAKSG